MTDSPESALRYSYNQDTLLAAHLLPVVTASECGGHLDSGHMTHQYAKLSCNADIGGLDNVDIVASADAVQHLVLLQRYSSSLCWDTVLAGLQE